MWRHSWALAGACWLARRSLASRRAPPASQALAASSTASGRAPPGRPAKAWGLLAVLGGSWLDSWQPHQRKAAYSFWAGSSLTSSTTLTSTCWMTNSSCALTLHQKGQERVVYTGQ